MHVSKHSMEQRLKFRRRNQTPLLCFATRDVHVVRLVFCCPKTTGYPLARHACVQLPSSVAARLVDQLAADPSLSRHLALDTDLFL